MDTGEPAVEPMDIDGDGYPIPEDCNDSNADIHPAAAEVCDGLDNDCDGQPDDGLYTTWYRDADQDGWGDPERSAWACAQPGDDWIVDSGDCDDEDPAVHPAADEYCDDRDWNCDGDPQAGAVDVSTTYLDADGDGYGTPDDSIDSCEPVTNYVSNDTDCNDNDPEIHPGAEEYCDGVDLDCDGIADDDQSVDVDTWYADADADGYGDPDTSTTACEQPSGYVDNAEDCDDTDASVGVCPDTYTIGNDTEFADASNHGPDYLLGSKLTVSSPCTLYYFGVIGKVAGPDFRMALYSDSGGQPDAFLVESTSTALVVGAQEVAVTPTSLAAGDYWVMGIYDSDASIGIDYSTPDLVAYISMSYSSAMPDPFGSASTYMGQKFNYYLVVE